MRALSSLVAALRDGVGGLPGAQLVLCGESLALGRQEAPRQQESQVPSCLAPGSGITDRVSRWEQGQHGVVFQGELITRMFQMCNMGAQVQRCRLLCGAAAGSSPEPGRRPVVPSSRAPSRLTEKTRVTQQHTSDNVGKY